MGLRSFLTDLFGAGPFVNPATGLPMMGRSVDVAGNPYGTDRRRDDDAGSLSGGMAVHDHDHHQTGSATSNDWSSSSWSGVSSSWPDHSSNSSSSHSGDYDPSRGW